MIRINLLKSQKVSGLPPLIGQREAVFGAALLALACVGLFYLSQRSGSNSKPPPKPAVARVEPASLPASLPVSVPQPPESPATAAAAPAPPPPAPVNQATGCTITAVSFETQADALVVRVRASGAPKHKSFELDKPDRLVIDLPGCSLDVPRDQSSQRVDHPPVERVRVSLFQENPPVVRLVLDLARMPRYQITPSMAGLDIRVPEASP
jgi:hypothetical protein